MPRTRQAHTKDQLQQVILLHEAYQRDFDSQDAQYRDLVTKITFMFGFVVAVLTLYGKFSDHVPFLIKTFTFASFLATLILLCLAFTNKNFNKPARLDTSVHNSNYFSKLYQDVSNIECTCLDNDQPLKNTAKYVRWSIYTLTVGVILLAISFML